MLPTTADWRALAGELAAALGTMPCVCVKGGFAWPGLKPKAPDYECRRCRVLARYHAATEADSAHVKGS